MNKRHILDYKQLVDILLGVIRVHGDMSERSPRNSDAGAVLQADRYADHKFQIDFAGIACLAENLQVVTGMDVTGNLGALAELMAHVAVMVNQPYGLVAGRRESDHVNPLASKIYMQFSISCVIRFARAYGYNISGIQNDKLSRALLTNDWEQLVKIFKECLQIAMHRTRSDSRGISEGNQEKAAIQYFEQQFSATGGRQLSAESWWNLHSVARQEDWSFADVVALIDAHMDPLLDPHLAYRSSTVSGSDWRYLYGWIHRPGGHRLWRVKDESSRK